MSHNHREIEDFLQDSTFRDWVLKPTSDSDAFWKNWLVEHPGKGDLLNRARILVKSLQFHESELTDKEKLLLLRRIKETNSLGKAGPKKAVVRPIYDALDIHNDKKSSSRPWLKYVAIAGGAILLAFAIHLFSGDAGLDKPVQLVEKINKRGQKSTIFLSDGTVVTLNSSSCLTYPEEFTTAIREVKLKGEAFFEVAHDANPFIVQMDNLEAKVLGTSFNARAFPDTDEFSISLVTGKVEVYPSQNYDEHIVLYPGEKATLEVEKETLLKSEFSYEEDILWKDGILFFDKTPFKKALQSMERWYGVEFNVDEMPRQVNKVTGKFDNESLEVVLRSISFTVRFDYEITGNKVNINFNRPMD